MVWKKFLIWKNFPDLAENPVFPDFPDWVKSVKIFPDFPESVATL